MAQKRRVSYSCAAGHWSGTTFCIVAQDSHNKRNHCSSADKVAQCPVSFAAMCYRFQDQCRASIHSRTDRHLDWKPCAVRRVSENK